MLLSPTWPATPQHSPSPNPARPLPLSVRSSRGYSWVRLRGDLPTAVARAIVDAARRERMRVMVVVGQTPLADVLAWKPDLVIGLGAFSPARSSPIAVPTGTGRRKSSTQGAQSAGRPAGTATTALPLDPATQGGTSNAVPAVVNPAESWRQARDANLLASAKHLAASGVTLAPMLRSYAQFYGVPAKSLNLDLMAGLELLPKSMRQQVEATLGAAANQSLRDGEVVFRRQAAFVKAWAEAGGKLGVATLAGEPGWPVPGLAVHEEMALFLAAGVLPLDALMAATLPAVTLLGAPRPWSVGSQADFFLVEGNVLEDPGALRRIRSVVRGGEVLEPARLIAQARRATTQR